MPELPEVETVKQSLKSRLLGKKIIIFEGGKIKKEYDLNHENYDRNILSPFFIELKKDILNSIKN